MQTIKLIIWDLDETFWTGTLSDGEVTPIRSNIELIKKFTDHGIVNSICSKNDFDKVKKELSSDRFCFVWEYFVFPSIDWTPKGQRVNAIIHNMNLRPVNCLFVDDNVNNLNEAKFINPELQIATPMELSNLLETEEAAFRGKDDFAHSRLNQYKILERKMAEQCCAGSNEEFLIQSAIKVEMIEKDLPLERIHEMIHRNNQLNFTKDRISKDEVKAIFSDPTIRSGVVHVIDKYGDHGIVGCYAVKDKCLLQFVFSCRILGMGVEQYVYQKLKWPDINVVGEVASSLKKGEIISYINQDYNTIHDVVPASSNCNQVNASIKMLVYGFCPLRPIFSYLEPQIHDIVFNIIQPQPSVCNLGALYRYSTEIHEFLCNNIHTYHKVYTFDKQIKQGLYNTILISPIMEETIFKYEYTYDNSDIVFYSTKLDSSVVDTTIFSKIKESPLTAYDIFKELDFFLKNISGKIRVFSTTVPEVVFNNSSKVNSFMKFRKELNIILERLAHNFSNFKLVDIRKYAKLETDFFEPLPWHYNRQIGYHLSSDILRILFKSELPQVSNSIATNSIEGSIREKSLIRTHNFNGCIFKTGICIINGVLYASIIESPKSISLLSCKTFVFLNRTLVYSCENDSLSVNVTRTGLYKVLFKVLCDDAREILLYTNQIDYNSYNFAKFIDYKVDTFHPYLSSINEFCNNNNRINQLYYRQLQQIIELYSSNVNICNFLYSKNIREISLFFENDFLGKALLSVIVKSQISIKYIFTSGNLYEYSAHDSDLNFNIYDLNINNVPLGSKDYLLMCVPYYRRDNEQFFKNSNCKLLYLDYILSVLMTRAFVKPKSPMTIFVKTPSLERVPASYSYLTSNENSVRFLSSHKVLSLISQNQSDRLPASLRYSDVSILLTKPCEVVRDGVPCFSDLSSPGVNITNGVRVTTGQPSSYVGKIYICGDQTAFGLGVKDGETIASYLQSIINIPYMVINYSNSNNFNSLDRMIKLINSTNFCKNDILIVMLRNSINNHELQTHWLNFDGIDPKEYCTYDASEMFLNKLRPDYYLLNDAYTKEFNLDIAKKLRDVIYQHISLFC